MNLGTASEFLVDGSSVSDQEYVDHSALIRSFIYYAKVS